VILRAIDSAKAAADTPSARLAKPRPIWEAIEANQRLLDGASEAWLITQPAHSALSGEIAAKLSPQAFGAFDVATIRAIALHDAGWSAFDSELIRTSRDAKADVRRATVSFVATTPKEAISAWTSSIETALKASLLGGLLVSEHFRTIAEMQAKERPGAERQMAAFVAQEDARQRKLRSQINLGDAAFHRMVDGLRFCDLLSLYICMGIMEPVALPQRIQQLSMVITPIGLDSLAIEPWPFAAHEEAFSVSALRHPRTKSVSSATFLCKVLGSNPAKG
jgi:hypothetical protein